MRVAWTTDPHLNFLSYPEAFGELVAASKPDAVLITGDISECSRLMHDMVLFQQGLGRKTPVWFVLGNHDAYGASVSLAKRVATSLQSASQQFVYLGSPDHHGVQLNESTWLVGVDGWYSASAGSPFESDMQMSDFSLIAEMQVPMSGCSQSEIRAARVAAARMLAFPEAELLKTKLNSVLRKKPEKIVVATHVPPYAEAALYKGKPGDAMGAPWFSNLPLGDVLDKAAHENPDVHFQVYCGHTHGFGLYARAPNLNVHVGAARYAAPSIAAVLEF